ncbi:dihydrodipicolinate synthetase [Cercophora scortea]|uniref:Dihydrodipicolinate synthetase n=1 Tax=Cercophora scortea TaxID=314031 RepID=A0AAE0IYW4_9PEZI|nr:dihydrodipicolinate synthetase [Cercophora scortea]
MPFPKVPASGVWCPAVTLFNPDTDRLDPVAQAKYYKYLSRFLTGLVILGTNAETFLLTREERKELLTTARAACGPDYPLMAGVSGHSTRQVLEFISDAAEAGANYALVLPPAYFGKATTPAVIDSFFADVAAASPLPIVVYNFPAVCNGIDLDSPTIAALARRHDNIVGVKLTCGSVAKITRLAAELEPGEFAIYGGQSDFLLGGLAVGSSGCIAAFANVFPFTVSLVYNLYKGSAVTAALKAQQEVALAEQSCKSGIAAVKYAASIYSAKDAGIEGAEALMRPRRPYLPLSEEAKNKVEEGIARLASYEGSSRTSIDKSPDQTSR